MSDETRDMLYDQLNSTKQILADLWDRMDGTGEAPEPPYLDDTQDMEDARQELDEMPLEIVWELGEPFAIVLGTGGPHIEIRGGTRHDGTSYALHGYWSGEHVVVSGEAVNRTGEYFRELVDDS